MVPLHKKISFFKAGKVYLLVIAAFCIAIGYIADSSLLHVPRQIQAKNLLQKYVQRAEKDFNKITNDELWKRNLFDSELSNEDFTSLGDNVFYLYDYKRTNNYFTLKLWSSNKILPPAFILLSKDSVGFASLPNGYYTWYKKNYNNHIVIGLLPVKWNYFVSNVYLRNNFVVDKGEMLSQGFNIDATKNKEADIKFLSGRSAFNLTAKPNSNLYHTGKFALFIKVTGLFLLFIWLQLFASVMVARKNLFYGMGILMLGILLLRSLSYVFNFPIMLRQWELFNPAVYGANEINRSLGALLINILLCLWVVLFFRFHFFRKKIQIQLPTSLLRWLVIGVGSIVLLVASFGAAGIVRSLVADAQISFDVLNFFSLSSYTIVSFIILTCLAVLFYFVCQLIYRILRPSLQHSVLPLFLCVSVFGLGYLSLLIGKMENGFELFVLSWLIVFLLLMSAEKFQLYAARYINSQVIFWLFFFSVSITAVIIRENNLKELRDRQQYAQVLAIRANPANEALLNSMLTDFRADFLARNFYRFADSSAATEFKDSLVTNAFSGYRNRYVTRIFAFDSSENSLNNGAPVAYNTLNAIMNTQAKPTNIQGLFAYEESYDKYNYIIKKTILNSSSNLLGYVFIQVFPKNAQNESPYPELFSRERNNNLASNNDYAYAIYNNDKLIRSQNNYPFSTNIKPGYFAGKQFLLIDNGSFDELWYNAGPGKAVVIVKPVKLLLESVTLFSYFFCCFLLLTALAWLLRAVLLAGFRPRRLMQNFTLTIREQIHGTIIFFSIVSFFVIGVATILFFISRYESNNREKLSNTLRIIENQFVRSIADKSLPDSTRQPLIPQVDSTKLAGIFSEISDIHGVEINLYDIDGNLKFSSLPLPYNKGVVSDKMEPNAYYHLHKSNEVQFFQKENIGSLSYLSCYRPLINENGNTFAYLNIPYFTSESRLRDEISNFIVTIINLNAFIFLIAGVVALFITNKITNTFLLIGQKMKAVNLGQTNEAIVWKRNDEIGKLVDEYNKMVSKLDESAKTMARKEREGAWEEMAKQVAHEIKNPLTPMKLSMQFLQKAIENDAPNVKELSASVARTLIEQIDHLDHMAGEFSRFARIEDSKMESLDLNAILIALKKLYETTPAAVFHWKLNLKPVIIKSDKTQMNRLFTNLIQNALQAVPDETEAQITISQEIKEGKIFITVRDNGTGISEETREKIFVPNFTTKSAGTGLGLAMSKRIVEQSGGDIYFETGEEGTSFIVWFPLIKS